jgi:hypothetical protein
MEAVIVKFEVLPLNVLGRTGEKYENKQSGLLVIRQSFERGTSLIRCKSGGRSKAKLGSKA